MDLVDSNRSGSLGATCIFPSAAELSDAPPENKQDWLHTVISEPQNKTLALLIKSQPF